MNISNRFLIVFLGLPLFVLSGCPSSVATTSATTSTSPSSVITTSATSEETSSIASSSEEVVEHTISFDEDGGTPVAEITLPVGSVVTAPDNPTKVGNTFDGWYANIERTIVYTFATMPAEDITLYAKWIVNQYTISFVENEGSLVADITADYGSLVTAPEEPTKEDHVFAGWFEDSELTSLYLFTTMPAEDITLYAAWTFDVYAGKMTIAEFKALLEGDVSYHELAGVAIMGGADMGIIVFADATGIMVAMSDIAVQVGDLVKVGGYRHSMDTFVIIGGVADEEVAVVTILDHDQNIPIVPETMTISEFNALDPTSSSNWMRYVQISGYLTIDEETHIVNLNQSEISMEVQPLNMEGYNTLASLESFDITISGLIMPFMDSEPVTILFLFNGAESSIELDYSEAELLIFLEEKFSSYFEAITYYPGQTVDFPDNRPLLDYLMEFTYLPSGENASLFDVSTYQISPEVDMALDITVGVTLTLQPGGQSTTFDLLLHVDPNVFISIANFKLMESDQTTIYIIQAIIIYKQAMEDGLLYMVADDTGILYINSDNYDLLVGDKIIAIGVKMTIETIDLLANDPSKTVDQVLSHDHPMPLEATSMTLAAFNALSPTDPATGMQYVALTGTLLYLNPSDPDNSMFGLTDGTDTIIVFPVDADVRHALVPVVGTLVTIHGLSLVTGEPSAERVILAFINSPGSIISNPT